MAFIEPEPALRLKLIPALDEPQLPSPEFQKKLRDFYEALRSQGIEVSARCYAHDAIHGGGGLSGEYVFIAATAIVQARKLIVEILKHFTGGTAFEAKKGVETIKGSARDVQKVLPPEWFTKLPEDSKTPRRQRDRG